MSFSYKYMIFQKKMEKNHTRFTVELAYHSGNVMDCHATALGSIPDRNGVFIELHVLRKGQ